MNRSTIFGLILLAAGSTASGQVVDRKALTLDGAKKVIASAEAEAVKNHVGCNIAVVDDGGNLIAFHRVDPTFPAGARVSIGKARTAALFRQPTRNFEEVITQKGRTSMIALDDFTPLEGGVPIVIADQIVGAIGVSGASNADQDEQFARIGAAALTMSTTAGVATEKVLVNADANGVVLHGYDPVAYFTDHAAVQGDARYQATYKGGKYDFASAANRDLFNKAPEKYAPQYGGYCAMAVAKGQLEDADPTMFIVHADRLLVQRNEKAHQMFMSNPDGFHRIADRQWPVLVEKNGK